ncbi:hypothetical protein NIES4103_53160 [Nostoc sp. NIES-4103]|nr:hypothetical protein NIES4103_53160 [Nostoc sp. NIES-4103]
MIQPNTLELAKQGDTEAIAFLMNRHLQPKGITATVTLQDACLQVMLESLQTPNQQALVTFVHKGITGLGAASIQKVKVYWQQTGKFFPAWSEEFNVDAAETELEVRDNEDDFNTPHFFTVSITLSGDSTSGLTSENFQSIADKMTKDIFAYFGDICIQKVSVINGSSVITKER